MSDKTREMKQELESVLKDLRKQGERCSELAAAACSRKVFEAMEELDKATDTRWWSDYETCFDRMATLYIEMGGDDKLLRERWPESF